MTAAVLSTRGLGKRYGKRWALRDCTLDLPPGAVAALIGPNGAGKTTLLHLAAGLLHPTAGSVAVGGADPADPRSGTLARVGLVAQDMPLYRSFTVADTLRLGRALNPGWRQADAEDRLRELGIPSDQKVGTLSGGQRAQVALALALAKRPELLLLDEPLAALDPLARRELLQTLMRTAADGDLTILLSSHLLTDLERVCDHLVVVGNGTLQLDGDIDELLRAHRRLVGPPPGRGSVADAVAAFPGVAEVIDHETGGGLATVAVRTDGSVGGPALDPRWSVAPIGLEDLVLAYLSQSARVGGREPVRHLRPVEVAS